MIRCVHLWTGQGQSSPVRTGDVLLAGDCCPPGTVASGHQWQLEGDDPLAAQVRRACGRNRGAVRPGSDPGGGSAHPGGGGGAAGSAGAAGSGKYWTRPGGRFVPGGGAVPGSG
jgi:hypothetical protein